MKQSKRQLDICSFEELQIARVNLKQTIKTQEESLKNNPIAKIAGSLNNSKSVTKSLKDGFSNLNLQSTETIISSILLTLKSTRKYYIGYIVAREMIPFVIEKVNEISSLKNKRD